MLASHRIWQSKRSPHFTHALYDSMLLPGCGGLLMGCTDKVGSFRGGLFFKTSLASDIR